MPRSRWCSTEQAQLVEKAAQAKEGSAGGKSNSTGRGKRESDTNCHDPPLGRRWWGPGREEDGLPLTDRCSRGRRRWTPRREMVAAEDEHGRGENPIQFVIWFLSDPPLPCDFLMYLPSTRWQLGPTVYGPSPHTDSTGVTITCGVGSFELELGFSIGKLFLKTYLMEKVEDELVLIPM